MESTKKSPKRAKMGRPKGSKNSPEVCCGSKLAGRSRTCRNPKGRRTDHPGEGRCWLHQGRPPVHGLYSKAYIEAPRVKDLIEAVEKSGQEMDLMGPLRLLHALTLDFVNRFEEMSDAILAWHSDLRDVDSWAESASVRQATSPEAFDFAMEKFNERWAVASNAKPRRVMDITNVATLIEKIGKLVQIIEKQRDSGVITLATYTSIMERMALAVVKHVHDRKVLVAINKAWLEIKVIE